MYLIMYGFSLLAIITTSYFLENNKVITDNMKERALEKSYINMEWQSEKKKKEGIEKGKQRGGVCCQCSFED